MSNLEAQFEDDMHNPYIVAKKELRYNAGYFLRIIEEHGSVGAAKLLIAKDAPSEGFGKLWELGRLDLTAEASILKPQSVSLFTDEEKNKARQRLAAAGWKSLPE